MNSMSVTSSIPINWIKPSLACCSHTLACFLLLQIQHPFLLLITVGDRLPFLLDLELFDYVGFTITFYSSNPNENGCTGS